MAEPINPLYFDYTGRSLTGKDPLLSADQLAYLLALFAPGSGLLDAAGQMPVMPAKNQSLLDAVTQGERGLSARENFNEGNYFTSLFQALGAGGDLLYAVPVAGPVLGPTVGSALKAPGAVQKFVKASKYLPTTQKNPNPVVGTRYKTEQVPNTQAARRMANLDEMLGASLMTYPTDMLSRNVVIREVSDIPLDRPPVTVGGLEYMSDLENMAKNIGYASNQAAATSQNNRALKAIEENLAMGGTGRVFMAPHTMPRGGENFSTTPTEGLLSIIDTVGINPQVAAELNDRVRNATVKGVKGKYRDFVGIGDSGLRDQLMTGEGLSVGSAGDLRKLFVKRFGSVTGQKGIGFNYQDLQNAMLNPNVMDKPPFWMGDSIYEALPHLGTSKGIHPAYSDDMPGQFFGNTSGAPVSEVMGEVYQRAKMENTGKPGPRGTYMDADQLARGSLSTAGENISLFIDEKELARLKRLFGVE